MPHSPGRSLIRPSRPQPVPSLERAWWWRSFRLSEGSYIQAAGFRTATYAECFQERQKWSVEWRTGLTVTVMLSYSRLFRPRSINPTRISIQTVRTQWLTVCAENCCLNITNHSWTAMIILNFMIVLGLINYALSEKLWKLHVVFHSVVFLGGFSNIPKYEFPNQIRQRKEGMLLKMTPVFPTGHQ